jgi:hypothetical protein
MLWYSVDSKHYATTPAYNVVIHSYKFIVHIQLVRQEEEKEPSHSMPWQSKAQLTKPNQAKPSQNHQCVGARPQPNPIQDQKETQLAPITSSSQTHA